MREFKNGTRTATLDDVGLFRERWEVKVYVNGILTHTKEYSWQSVASEYIRKFLSGEVN